MRKGLKELAEQRSDKGLVKMYVEIYNRHFADHAVFDSCNPNSLKTYVVKSNTVKGLWQARGFGDFAVIIFNDKLTDEEIKKGMVHILASFTTCTTRWNDRQKMKEVERVANEMGTTKEDIMNVGKINLEKR